MWLGPRSRKRENGLISLSGLVGNILVGLGFPVLSGFEGFLGLVASTGFMVNFWLAAFNLLAFGMLDGQKVFSWSRLSGGPGRSQHGSRYSFSRGSKRVVWRVGADWKDHARKRPDLLWSGLLLYEVQSCL
jgi:hypothetical protein